MTGPDEIAVELEEIVQRFGLVPVVEALARICSNRADQIGTLLRQQSAARSLAGLVRGFGHYLASRREPPDD